MDLDFDRECLQTDIHNGINITKWSERDKKHYMEKLFPNGFFVYDDNDSVIDIGQIKLLDFVNSKT